MLGDLSVSDVVARPDEARRALLFGIRRSIRYHTRRRAFFEQLHVITSAIGVLAGSAVAVALWKTWYNVGIGSALIVAFFSTLDLVIGFSRMAWTHRDLARRFREIEQRLSWDSSPETVRSCTEKRLEIEAEEPPPLRVLDTLCHNEQLRSEGYHPTSDAEQFIKVQWYQRLFSNWIDINEASLQKTNPSS